MLNIENEYQFDTLSEAVNRLTLEGFKEDFQAGSDHFIANYSKRRYMPNELKIRAQFRFEGNTDPEDSVLLLAIETVDGTKGTLVMSYTALHGQNEELIKRIPTQQ